MEEKEVKEEKLMCAIVESTLTKLIKAVNEFKVQKDDIVTLTKTAEQWILVYYV